MQKDKIDNSNIWLVILIVGIIVELSLQTFAQKALGIYISPILWMTAGIMFCVAALFLIGFKSQCFAKDLNILNGKEQ